MTSPPGRALANSRKCFGHKYRNVQPPPKILPTKCYLLNDRSMSNISSANSAMVGSWDILGGRGPIDP